MKTPTRPLPLALSLAALPALGADAPFGADQLDALLVGNTVYLDVPAGGPMGDGGETPIRFAADGTANARLPTGAAMAGRWRLEASGYCVDWDPAPRDSCTTVTRGGGAMTFVDPGTGDARGTVLRIVPGDPEGFGG